jgi:replication factor C subunit 3/5
MATTENQSKNGIPWVEKYRPAHFDDIVLDPTNRQIFKNILDTNYFPNLLFYGPPGTGKTTTIINLINEYQTKYNQKNKGTVIHLNASDERGIDIIRNQIYQFVKSKNFFETGLKFVILDEVDYMTKNAQQALKYLLQSSCYNVRFCLICNYISKIDESLKNEFICVRFNQLPKKDIYKFIKHISESENISLSDEVIDTIQKTYHSDIRSMINFIQLNQNIVEWESNIIRNAIWEHIHFLLTDKSRPENEIMKEIVKYIHDISIQYNIDKKNIMNQYFDFVLQHHFTNFKKTDDTSVSIQNLINEDFLNVVENISHGNESNIAHMLNYFISKLREIYRSST